MKNIFADLHGRFLEDLTVGMTAYYGRTVGESDIIAFAGLSGDYNPLHVNQEFAAKTRFKERIAHGMLSASFISTVIGTRLPGPGCVYISQTLKFKAPVRIGDTVVAKATIKEIITAKKRIIIDTVCTVGETVVTEGEAVILVPSREDYAEIMG